MGSLLYILNIINKILDLHPHFKIMKLREPSESSIKLITILRIRNEELILKDTLDHLASFCDYIVAFDDASTDNSYKILKNHPKVLSIIRNFVWDSSIEGRILAETLHRKCLLELAKEYRPEWVLCADADERFIGDIRAFVESDDSLMYDVVRIPLFDAYMTPDDFKPFSANDNLLNFRKYFGIERRDTLILFRNQSDIYYEGADRREPTYNGKKELTKFHCQHYGKAISVQQWESTCEYYIKYFPWQPYGIKWSQRKGKGIHKVSDFDTELYEWGEMLFGNAVRVYP